MLNTIAKDLPMIFAIWAASTAILSLLNAKVIRPNFPKAGNVIGSIVAISPADIEKLWEEISAVLPKKDPPAGK